MKKRILVVDDEESVGEGLVAVLSMYGYEAAHVTSAGAALRSLGASRPHAIILDVVLDEEDGLTLYREIAKRWPDVPVVMVTGYADDPRLPPDSPRLTRLFKPFDSDEMMEALEKLWSE